MMIYSLSFTLPESFARKNKCSFLSYRFVPFERILILEESYHYLHPRRIR